MKIYIVILFLCNVLFANSGTLTKKDKEEVINSSKPLLKKSDKITEDTIYSKDKYNEAIEKLTIELKRKDD